MTVSNAIIKRITEYCNENKITISKLCTISGATQSTINDIMNGVTTNPGVVTIKKLCDGMGITLTEFFNTDYFNTLEQEIKRDFGKLLISSPFLEKFLFDFIKI